MPAIVILADDFSGAAELAGLAFSHGLTAEVQRELDLSSTARVVALDTATRQLPPRVAAQRLQVASAGLRDQSDTLLYKKVDSLLRGNVRAEIEALMRAAGYCRTILVPANPSRGRTIVGGRYLIGGQPLDESPLAHDPHHPRRSADVAALLGKGDEHLHVVPSGFSLPPAGLIIPDVSAQDHLAHLADQVDHQTLAAGAADFFTSLLRIRAKALLPPLSRPLAALITPPALLVCGSRLAWPARRQAAQIAGMPVLEAGLGGGVCSAAAVSLLGFGDHDVAPQTALGVLTALAAALLSKLNFHTVLVEGGETAAALAENLKWTRFHVVADAPAGVGVLRPLSNTAPLLLTKPGSYPWPPEIWDTLVKLT